MPNRLWNIAVVALFFAGGCKSSGSGGQHGEDAGVNSPPGEQTPLPLPGGLDQNNPPSDPATPSGSPDNGSGTAKDIFDTNRFVITPVAKETLKKTFAQTPETYLSASDLITRDFASDSITELEMKRQKICLFNGADCLMPAYRPAATAKPEPCGAELADEVASYLQTTPELRNLIPRQLDSIPVTPAESPATTMKSFKKLDARYETSILRYRFKNFDDWFEVRDFDENAAFFIQFVDKRIVEPIDGQTFELYYDSHLPQAEETARLIISTIQTVYPKLKKDIFQNTPLQPFGHHREGYRIYMVQSADSKLFEFAHHEASYGTDGYIVLRSFWFKDETNDFFKRTTMNWTRQQLVEFIVTHELFHAFESAFLGFGHDLSEALASFGAAYALPKNNYEHDRMGYFLYLPDRPYYDPYPVRRKYGVSHLFSFLWYYHASIEPIVKFLKTAQETQNGEKSMKAALSNGGSQDPDEVFHEFAKANLNLTPTPSGIVDYTQKDPGYQREFLSAARGFYLLPGPALTQGALAIHSVDVKVRELASSSIQYFAFGAVPGNALNHLYRIDASSLTKKGAKASAFYIQIDKRPGRDRYTVLGSDRLGDAEFHKCFRELDREPDVVLLAVSNGAWRQGPIEGHIKIITEPFCKGETEFTYSSVNNKGGPNITLSITQADLAYRPDSLTKISSVDTEIEAVDVKARPMNIPDFQNMNAEEIAAATREMTRNMEASMDSLALDGTLTWKVSGSTSATLPTDDQGGTCTVTTVFSGETTQTATDIAKVVFPRAAIAQDGTSSFTINFSDKFPVVVTATSNDTCGGGEGASAYTAYVIDILPVEIANGRKRVSGSTSTATEQKTWTLTLPQPAELARVPQNMEEMEDSLLMIFDRRDPLFGQLKAPLIDIVSVTEVEMRNPYNRTEPPPQ